MNSSVQQISATQCMKCGFCMSTCPVYQVDHVESHVARGRNLLIRMAEQQSVPDQDDYGACLDACLLCGRCQAVCPAGVPSPEINIQAREKRLSEEGVPLWQQLLYRGILKHRPLMAQLIRVAALIPGLNHSEGRPLRHMADATALLPVVCVCPYRQHVFVQTHPRAHCADPMSARQGTGGLFSRLRV